MVVGSAGASALAARPRAFERGQFSALCLARPQRMHRLLSWRRLRSSGFNLPLLSSKCEIDGGGLDLSLPEVLPEVPPLLLFWLLGRFCEGWFERLELLV